MSLVRRLSLRSVLNGHRHRSSSSCLILLHQTPREKEEPTLQTRNYHSLLHQSSLVGTSTTALSLSRNCSAFQSPLTISSDRFISTFNFHGSGDAVVDWLLQSVVSRGFELHNVADALVSLNHLITLVNSFTFSQWWVCIIVVSLLIRGMTIPVMVDLLNYIANIFKSLGSHQGEILNKVSVFSKSRSVMYTMLEKEYLGVKGSIIGQGIQVPIFWFSMGELKQNMLEILISCLRGKVLSAELIRNGVLSRGRLVVVVGDGFALIDPSLVRGSIESALKSFLGPCPVTVFAVGNLDDASPSVLEKISSSGILLRHTPMGGLQVDDLIRDEWIMRHPPPGAVMLISGDSTWFLGSSTFLEYTVLRAYNGSPPPISHSPSPRVWGWESLLKEYSQCEITSDVEPSLPACLCFLCEVPCQSFDDFVKHLKSEEHIKELSISILASYSQLYLCN